MGTIVEFPAYAATRRPVSSVDNAPRKSATVLILPVIRIERYAEEPAGRGPAQGAAGRRRKRRARS